MKEKLIRSGSKRVFIIAALIILTAILGLVMYTNTAIAADSSDVPESLRAQEYARIEQYRKDVDRQHRIQEIDQKIAVAQEQKVVEEEAAKAAAAKAAEEAKAVAEAQAKEQAAAAQQAAVAETQAKEQAAIQVQAVSTTRNAAKGYNTKVLSASGLTAADLDRMAAGRGMEGLGASFIQAEQNYGVNAGFLFSLAVIESGWGESSMATSKNNLFGFGGMSFQSKAAGIDYVAKFLKDKYLSPSGPYYRGDAIINVNEVYCPTGSSWSDNILSIWNRL